VIASQMLHFVFFFTAENNQPTNEMEMMLLKINTR
jgi:hypothetical protein